MAGLTDLDRRLSRRIETGRGIQLSADDLDLLVTSGAYAVFRDAVAKHQRELCLHRSERSRSTSGENTGSSGEATAPPSRSSGTTASESANEALARAQRMSKPGVLRSIGST